MKHNSTTLRVVGYARVSTARQTLGDSLDAQDNVIRDWAREHGHHVVAVIREDGLTGTVDESGRPGLLKALRMIESGQADILVIKELDRFSRKLYVQEAVLAKVWAAGGRTWEVVGDREVLCDDPSDPMRTALRQMQGVFVQLERGMVVARLQGARQRKRARGGYVGGRPPYGWRIEDGERIPVPAEQEVLSWLRAEREPDGSGATYEALADSLNERGTPTQRGGRWHPASVRRVLVNAPELVAA
jgi:DNA invertase Pin-like site-specific DNA recombinase